MKKTDCMKVLLIDPPGWDRGVNVGLAYLDTSLTSNGFQVKILDLNNQFLLPQEIVQFVRSYMPDIVGVSIKSKTLQSSMEITRLLAKTLSPTPVFVAGGPHVTLMKDEMQELEDFNYYFLGEAEESFPNLIRELEGESNSSVNYPKMVSGTAVMDLDMIGFPRFDSFFPQPRNFTQHKYPLVTSRGCPFTCSYCSVGLISGRKFRYRSPESVVAELIEAKERYSIIRFEILDDNFTFQPDRAKRICELLIEENLHLEWTCPNGIWARSIDRELAMLMRQSGCRKVWLGIESADENVFRQIQKGETLDHIRAAIRYLKEAEIEVGGFFIIGLPGDTLERSLKSLDFIKETRLDSVFFNLFVPYPKTAAWNWVHKNGKMLSDFNEGAHYGERPIVIFDTEDMPARNRIMAFERIHTRLRRFSVLIPQFWAFPTIRRVFYALKSFWHHDRRAIPC